MWFNESVFYQIYTLNFCGAPRDNDGIVEHRILRLNDFMDYFEDLGINAIYFNPVFSSDHHGYDTRDYCKIDERLGTNEDFIEICKNLHDRGMRVVLDGVFNHVGRGFFAFQDVLNNRENSQYKDWFRIDFNGNSPYDDGFYYEGWEGHYELVKLNLDHPDVQNYLLSAVDYWIDAFDIDTIRKASQEKSSSFAYSLNNGPLVLPINDQVYATQAKIIKHLAEKEDCIIVNGCANYILEDYPHVLRIFVYAPLESRIERVEKDYKEEHENTKKYVQKRDKQRKSYYNYYTTNTWANMKDYDLCINSDMGIDEIAQLIVKVYQNGKLWK